MFWGIKNHLRRTSLAKAKHSSNAGEPSRLIKQADSGLGDAAMALAAEADQAGDHVAAFTWYAMAAKTRNWLDDRSRVARLQWDRRRFQGLGVQVDHLALMHEWGQHHWPGYERELPLAWIQSRGPDSMRCIDPVNSCSGVNVEGNDDEHPDGRRHQALDSQA